MKKKDYYKSKLGEKTKKILAETILIEVEKDKFEKRTLLEELKKPLKIPRDKETEEIRRKTLPNRIKQIRTRYAGYLNSTNEDLKSESDIPILENKSLDQVSKVQRKAYYIKEEMRRKRSWYDTQECKQVIKDQRELMEKVDEKTRAFQEKANKIYKDEMGYNIPPPLPKTKTTFEKRIYGEKTGTVSDVSVKVLETYVKTGLIGEHDTTVQRREEHAKKVRRERNEM